jgi:hypothetical protein
MDKVQASVMDHEPDGRTIVLNSSNLDKTVVELLQYCEELH